mmetsp:Transcript_34601/g.78390  ORF Transcript_34601/g.78390 Transcript_34601/m.78390 type:complete len:101 (-) Transcript_34601:42-344(-)
MMVRVAGTAVAMDEGAFVLENGVVSAGAVVAVAREAASMDKVGSAVRLPDMGEVAAAGERDFGARLSLTKACTTAIEVAGKVRPPMSRPRPVSLGGGLPL